MAAVKTGLLWLFCAIDAALGFWLAQVFISAMRTSGAARTVTLENAAYIMLAALLLIVPVLCWLLRARASLTMRVMLAAAPIALFLGLGGKLWVRWV